MCSEYFIQSRIFLDLICLFTNPDVKQFVALRSQSPCDREVSQGCNHLYLISLRSLIQIISLLLYISSTCLFTQKVMEFGSCLLLLLYSFDSISTSINRIEFGVISLPIYPWVSCSNKLSTFFYLLSSLVWIVYLFCDWFSLFVRYGFGVISIQW